MKQAITKFIILFCLYMAFSGNVILAQCNWTTTITDDFEYTTTCPNLIPGTVIHNTPQSFAVHSGTYSLYLNFINCVNGTGTCAGAKVYERGFTVCRNQPIRFSSWLTTSFSGTQCNVRIKISDSNGNVLDDQLQIAAPYAPAWLQYQSAVVTPLSDSIIFTMYTNVGGGNGNDLSMDDFLMETCSGGNLGNSTTPAFVCEDAASSNLYSLFPAMNDTTGNWSGPSSLGGGYLGTFIPGTNLPGNYIYANPFFGTGAGCPLAYDTLAVTVQQPPAVNLGADTTICTNQSILLNAGSSPGSTYLWNNGVTGPTVLAFTTSLVNTSATYSVVLTDNHGCSNSDSITVSFVVCSGLDENSEINGFNLYPNPTNGHVYIQFLDSNIEKATYTLFNSIGKEIETGAMNQGTNHINVMHLSHGIYWLQIKTTKGVSASRKLIVLN